MTTDVSLDLLSRPDLRFVLFVPRYKEDFFFRQYGNDRVAVEGVDTNAVWTWGYSFFKWLSFSMIPTYAVWLRRREELYRDRSPYQFVRFAASRIVNILFSRIPLMRRLVRFGDRVFSPYRRILPHILRHRPDCLFVTDLFSDIEPVFIHASLATGIPVIGMARSWDNMTTKGLLRAVPDRVIVNTEILKEEAVTLHSVDPAIITVTGVPQFDRACRGYASDRSAFCRALDIDPSCRIVFFGPAGMFLSDRDAELCEILKEGLDQGQIPADVRFVISKHPGDPPDLGAFAPDDRFRILSLGTPFSESRKVTEMTATDASFLIDCLYHSSIVMCVNSTLGIDSLPFDKPQIMVEFDGRSPKPYIESVARYHDEDHMRKYLDTGAVRIVRSPDEWFDAIGAYLADPSLDRANRARAAQDQLYLLDGRSGSRVAAAILDFMQVAP